MNVISAPRPQALEQGGLLSIEASAQSARALRWWTGAQCERLAAIVDDSLRDWRRSWGIERGAPPTQMALHCEPAAQGPRAGMAWQALTGGAQAGHAWCALAPARTSSAQDRGAPSPLWDALLPYLLEHTAPRVGGFAQDRAVKRTASLAQDTAHAAWGDCLQQLGALFDAPGAAARREMAPAVTFEKPPAEIWRPWSGALSLTARWSAVDVHVLIDDRCVAATLRSSAHPAAAADASPSQIAAEPMPELVPLGQALAALPVTMRVELASVELALAALTAMRVGDLLRTPHALSEPLIVVDSGNQTFCGGFLGSSNGQRAIELLREAPSNRQASPE